MKKVSMWKEERGNVIVLSSHVVPYDIFSLPVVITGASRRKKDTVTLTTAWRFWWHS